MARPIQNIDFAGPEVLLRRALGLASQHKLEDAMYWAATAAQKVGGAAFFDSNALAGALLAKLGQIDSAIYYWDRIIRSAPQKLQWLEQAIRIFLECDTEKSAKALKSWLEALQQVYIETPSPAFLGWLHEKGHRTPGSIGIHGGRLKGWIFGQKGVGLNLHTQIPGNIKFTLNLHPVAESPSHLLYKIDEILPVLNKPWQIDLSFADGSRPVGCPLICSGNRTVTSALKTRANKLTILIPAYDDAKATLSTLGSLFASLKYNLINPDIVVVWDKGPDQDLKARLDMLAERGKIRLLENDVNLGFLGSVNHALSVISSGDVILLNADTLVHGNWLDRMADAARSSGTATVTVLSNEAELMSYPSSQDRGKVRTLTATAILDKAASAIPPGDAKIEIPVGVGFCMLITREALDKIGGLDGYHVFRGYGEESDFCLRAAARGLKNFGLFNVFVAHLGERSFGGKKKALAAQNNVAIFERFPDYQKSYELALRDKKTLKLRKRIALNTLQDLSELPALEIRPWGARFLPPWIRDEDFQPDRKGAALFLLPGQRALLRIWAEIPVYELLFDLPAEEKELLTALQCLKYKRAILFSPSVQSRTFCHNHNLDISIAEEDNAELAPTCSSGERFLGAPPLSFAGYKRLHYIATKNPAINYYIFHMDSVWADALHASNIHEIPIMQDYGSLSPAAFLMFDNFQDSPAWSEWLAAHNCAGLHICRMDNPL